MIRSAGLISRSLLLAAAASLFAAGAASADPVITIGTGFEHGLKLTAPATNVGPTSAPPSIEYRSDAAGKGAGYSALAESIGNQVFFYSGTMAAGGGNAAYSSVQVNLNLSNLGDVEVKGLTSTIFQSTFGFYVAPFTANDPACNGSSLPSCGGSTAGQPGFAAMADAGKIGSNPYGSLFPFTQNPADGSLAGTGFLFSVLVDNIVQDQFGGLLMMRDNGTNPPVVSSYSLIDGIFSSDISLLTGKLPGFSLLASDDLAIIYGWDQSNFTSIFDSPITGAGGTVSYQIKTFSFSDVLNLDPDSSRSIISFSCFADPVGRGSTAAAILPVRADPTCDDFTQLGASSKRDYVLNLGGIDADGNLLLTGVIPEPDTWAMLILGFGLVGLSLRRQGKSKTVSA